MIAIVETLWEKNKQCFLVCGFNPFEKIFVKLGSFVQGSGVKIKNV